MIAHFYHAYVDGNWQQPVSEHFEALTRYGLLAELDSIHIGYVGTPDNIAAAKLTVEHYAPMVKTVAESVEGWEQETLDPLYDFVQNHDGLVSYAHTKGSSRSDPVDTPWRRTMTYHCFVDWRRPVAALESGKSIAGCYWHESHVTPPKAVPGYGNGGMFGGNFWWTYAELLRRNVRPGRESRFAAEHWLGQLSEVMPITADTICDLVAGAVIGEGSPVWWDQQISC